MMSCCQSVGLSCIISWKSTAISSAQFANHVTATVQWRVLMLIEIILKQLHWPQYSTFSGGCNWNNFVVRATRDSHFIVDSKASISRNGGNSDQNRQFYFAGFGRVSPLKVGNHWTADAILQHKRSTPERNALLSNGKGIRRKHFDLFFNIKFYCNTGNRFGVCVWEAEIQSQ